MHDPITEESLLLHMRRGNYHLIFVKSYFYNLCTIPRQFRCYSQNVPKSKHVPELVKTSRKKGQNVPVVKNVGQNVPKMIFFLYLHISTHMVYGLSINPERVKKRKGFGQMYLFQTFFPVHSSFCGGTKSHMVPLAERTEIIRNLLTSDRS